MFEVARAVRVRALAWVLRQVGHPPATAGGGAFLFTPAAEEVAWAREVIAAFTTARGAAARLTSPGCVGRNTPASLTV
jgi:hypothetical protein